MKLAQIAIATLILAGCAHGKMGKVEHAVDSSAISKTTPIYVEQIDPSAATFTGDKANDTNTQSSEKNQIQHTYNMRIVDALRAKGYTATVAKEKVTKGIVLSGKVTKIGHGSGAARYFVGMGAGQANLITDFHLEDRTAKKTLGKFEIIATSGGESRPGSYMEKHLEDGSKKVAEYIAGEKKE